MDLRIVTISSLLISLPVDYRHILEGLFVLHCDFRELCWHHGHARQLPYRALDHAECH
jgi:hypothetical protein